MAWPKSYRFRYKFTISTSNIDSDLTDFPVALHINSAAGSGASDLTKIFDVVGANWQNLCVTSSNEVTPLWTEVDLWDAANENGVLHVRVPKVSSSAQTLLYLYFDADGLGNGYIGATGSAAGQAVWDENFIAVNHLSQDPTGTVLDSTSHATNGVSSGSMTSGDLVDGGCGKAIDFDGSDDLITFTDSDGSLDVTDAVTVEAYINQDVHDIHGASILNKDDAPGIGSYGDYGLIISSTAGRVYFFLNENAKPIYFDGLALDTWTYLAGTYDRIDGNMYLYKNGVQEATDTYSTAISTSSTKYYMGYYWGSTNQANFDGMISEARISNIARSAAWLKATYYTLFDDMGEWGSLEGISQAPDGAWLGTWKYRQQIVVKATNIDSDLSDFPVAIFINANAGIGNADLTGVFDEVGANSHKIAVTDHTGLRQLYVEVDNWDSTNFRAVLHVKVPLADSSTDGYLYLYYDGDKTDNDGYVGDPGDAAAQNVWDDDFAAVWHMNGDPSVASDIKNSKADSHHLTGVNMESGDLVDSDTIGKGVDIDGSNEYMVCALSGLPLANEEKTVEFLSHVDTGMTGRMGCGSRLNYGGVDNDIKGWVLSLDISGAMQRYYHAADGEYSYETAPTADTDFLASFSCSTNGSSPVLYLNGSAVTPDTDTLSTGSAENSSGYFAVGRESTNYGNGTISEIRLSSSIRSAAWLKATYYTLADNFLQHTNKVDLAETLSGFTNRIKLTIDSSKIDSNLTDFPVAIFLNSASGQINTDLTPIFDELGANYLKIAVTTSDGTTQCYVEVDWWDSSAEEAVLHVKVPSILAFADTVLYLYYDSTASDNTTYVGATGDTAAQNVWDDNFVAVYHLSTVPTSPNLDSTSNGRSIGSTGSMTTDDLIDAHPGKGLEFDGNDDLLYVTASPITAYPFTLEAAGPAHIVASDNANPSIHVVDRSAAQQQESLGVYNGYARLNHYNTSNYFALGTELLSEGVFCHLAAVGVSSTERSVFTNGGNKTTDTDSSGCATGLDTLCVGGAYDSSPGYFPGTVSEARFSDIARSDAWIKATYYTLFDTLITAVYTEGNPAAWEPPGWLNPYSQRHLITIPTTNIDEGLDYFPVTLFLSSSCGTGTGDMTAVFDEIGANSRKLAVTLADGRTQCPIEIELWDDTGEEAVLHVRVPNVSSSDTTYLYLYFSADVPDNNEYVGVAGESPAMSVWSNEFVGVWHLNQDPSGTAPQGLDSTVYQHHGTAQGTMLTGDLVDGVIGKATDFDGSDDYYLIPETAALDAVLSPFSVEAIIKVASDWVPANDDYSGILYKGYTNVHPGLRIYERSAGPETRIEFGGTYDVIANSFANGSWKYVAGVAHNRTNDQIFIDGADVGTYDNQTKTTFVANDYDLRIADLYPNTADYVNFPGIISEARISKTDRTDAWIKATYYSLFDGLIAYDTTGEAQTQWLGSWAKRIKLTIDSSKIGATLSNFPVAVKLSASSGILGKDVTAIFSELGANDLKMAVTTSDGVTETYAEVAYWDAVNMRAELHVLIPSISSSVDTVFFLYFDSTQADNTTYIGETGDAAAEYVWDTAGFEAVYHMSQDPSGSLLDSTSNGHDGTFYGSMDSNDLVESPKGMALEFDGSDDYITTPNSTNLAPNQYDYTYEAFYRTSKDYADAQGRIYNDYGNDVDNYLELSVQTTNKISHYMRDLGGDALAIQTAGAEINDGVWHHNVMARDTLTHMDAYEDGAWIGEDTNGAVGNVRTYDGSAVPTFGKHASSSTLYFKGQIAEVRLTFNEARDADWVAATYYTLMDELIYVSTPVIYNNWPKGWTNRRAFVIPGTNIDDTLTDFPITLHLSSSSGTGTEDITDIFDEVGENYKRLAVADARGRLLPTEVELWDATAENGILHVKVPRIDSDYGAILFLYFNDNQPDQGWTDVVQSGLSPRVWSNGYGAVYHLNNDPTGGSGCILDSATLDDDDSGTPYGSMTAGDLLDDKAGGIGQSLDLDADDWIILTDNADIGGITGDITIEALAHRASVSGNNTGIVTKYDSSNDTGWVLGHLETGELSFTGRAKGGSYYNSGSTVNTYDDDNWFYAAGRRDGSTWKIWGNAGAANDIASATGGSGDISGGSIEARIGCTYVGSNINFFGTNGSGHVGEARISSVARSDAFLKATYYTLFDDLGEWGVVEAEPVYGEIEIELTNLSLEITVHSLSTELSMTLYLGTPSVEITPHALSTSYIGNIVKMIGVDASRPRIADASSKRAGIAKATGSHPGLAAAEAFEYQERE